MSDSHSALSSSDTLEHQRKFAKDLLRSARAGDAEGVARIRRQHPDVATPTLADAQLTIAREAGFESWPKLAAHLQERESRAFQAAVTTGDVTAARRLLDSSKYLRKQINAPAFAFGQRALHVSTHNPEMLDLLLSFGADLNLRSDWKNGPYTVLDNCDETSARFLIGRGATLTANVASRLGWFDDLRRIVEANPSVVHERGGDGQQPLHQARTAEMADYLLERGAGIDVPCIDHKTTPAQYALTERPEVCRRLLEHSATPDIFMAAHLGDAGLAERLIDEDPSCLAARINAPGYAPVPPFNIYCWTLGFFKSPHEVALEAGHRRLFDLFTRRSAPRIRFMEAAFRGDEASASEVMSGHATMLESLTMEEHANLAHAIHHGRGDAAALMLRLGFDPLAPGVDGGSALHQAAWVGSATLVERLIQAGRVPLDLRDPTHHSTPLGWAAYGSVHCRAKGADYVRVIERLIAAGARVDSRVVAAADGNPRVQEVLRRHVAG